MNLMGRGWAISASSEKVLAGAVLFTALILSSCLLFPGDLPAKTPDTLGKWTKQHVHRHGSGSMMALDCISRSHCEAVGQSYGTGLPAATWNGHRWIGRRRAPAPANSQINSVSCVSVHNCMAVGEYSNSAGVLTEHLKGRRWKNKHAPTSQSWGLFGVSCVSARFCMAVGVRNPPPGSHGVATGSLIERWNGHRWSRVGAPSHKTDVLWDVSCVSGRSCVAVGSETHPRHFIVEQWNGSHWKRKSIGRPAHGGDDFLLDISCPRAGECFAVGGDQGINNEIERLHHGRWSRSKIRGISGSFRAIDCATPTHCVAGGSAYNSRTQTYPALASAWNGNAWSTTFIPVREGYSGNVDDISCPTSRLCVGLGQAGGSRDGFVWRR